MADKKEGRLYLEVLTGENKGITCWLNPDKPILVGSGEVADLRIDDPEAKAEHAVIKIIKNQVWVENVSSSGTLLNGRNVRDRAIVLVDETIGIGPEVKIVLRSTGEKSREDTSPLLIPLLIAVMIAGSILLAVVTSKPRRSKKKSNVVTAGQWNSAYRRLDTRLKIWVREKRLSRIYADEFTEAWFRDQGGDRKGALQLWKRLYNGLIGLNIAGATPAGRTVASSAAASPKTLYIIMGRDPDRDPDDALMWKGDDASYASAWWWFVNKRIDFWQKENK
ncbi:MAG: FHA domain-containing protein [Planctomycetota bacterium]|jgi:hypothetical protein